MKRALEWHETCFKNQCASLEREERRLARLIGDVNRLREMTAYYESQIARARRENRDGFDENRFKP